MYESCQAGMNPFAWSGPPTANWNMNQQNFRNGQDIKFVNGIEEARNCTIPLGSRIILMDKEKDRFYLKETDLQGVSVVSEYEFKKVEAEASKEYVTKDDLQAFSNQITEQIKQQMEEQYESIVQAARCKQSSTPQHAAVSFI